MFIMLLSFFKFFFIVMFFLFYFFPFISSSLSFLPSLPLSPRLIRVHLHTCRSRGSPASLWPSSTTSPHLCRCAPAPPPRLRRWCHLLLFGILCGLHLLHGLVGRYPATAGSTPSSMAGRTCRPPPSRLAGRRQEPGGTRVGKRERGCVRFVIWVAAIWV
jgi:hypothetical protein